MDDAPTEDGVHLVIAAAELAMLREMADSMPCERLGQCSTAALFNSGEDASFLDAPGAFSLAQRALASTHKIPHKGRETEDSAG